MKCLLRVSWLRRSSDLVANKTRELDRQPSVTWRGWLWLLARLIVLAWVFYLLTRGLPLESVLRAVLIIAGLVVVVVYVVWRAFFRPTEVSFPLSFNSTVESKKFSDWLNNEAKWVIWGRRDDGSYYMVTHGSLWAYAIKKKWLSKR